MLRALVCIGTLQNFQKFLKVFYYACTITSKLGLATSYSFSLSSLSLHSLLRLERCCAHYATPFLSVGSLPPGGMDADCRSSCDGRRPQPLVAISSLASPEVAPERWWLLHRSLYSTTMNFGRLRSCNVVEEAQSAGSHHVGDWLALCHLPDLRICHMLGVRNAEDLL